MYNFACGFDFRKLLFFPDYRKKVKFCRRVLFLLANLFYQFLSTKELNSKKDFYDKRCLLKHSTEKFPDFSIQAFLFEIPDKKNTLKIF